jgi:hypothetical protein
LFESLKRCGAAASGRIFADACDFQIITLKKAFSDEDNRSEIVAALHRSFPVMS